jgi:small subunit ribosomal protein S9
MAEDERPDAPQDDQAAGEPTAEGADASAAAPAEDTPAAPVEAAAPDEPAADDAAAAAVPPAEAPDAAAAEVEAAAPAPEPAADDAAAAETPADDAAAPAEPGAAQAPAAADATPAAEPRRQRPPREDDDAETPAEPAAVPGAHLEPDLVLEAPRAAGEGEIDPYADPAAADDDSPVAEGEAAATVEETPAHTPLDLAADARYPATGKRKRAIARVILRPGTGAYTINGKELDTYFPRITLQKTARLPLETAGYETRMDVVAKIHGGGVSSQAIALRHGIARALVEADPNLRGELKRHGFLTRDARVKERKKAGLKKARKRPQFSKR